VVTAPAESEDNMKKDYLYHYTCEEYVKSILENGLKLTPSNLLPPVNMRIINGSLVSDTDGHKPVVWFTDSKSAEKNGLEGSILNKKKIRVVVEKTEEYKFWNTWARRNYMDKRWKKALIAGYNYLSWFIIERPVSVEEIIRIEDVMTGEILYEA